MGRTIPDHILNDWHSTGTLNHQFGAKGWVCEICSVYSKNIVKGGCQGIAFDGWLKAKHPEFSNIRRREIDEE